MDWKNVKWVKQRYGKENIYIYNTQSNGKHTALAASTLAFKFLVCFVRGNA